MERVRTNKRYTEWMGTLWSPIMGIVHNMVHRRMIMMYAVLYVYQKQFLRHRTLAPHSSVVAGQVVSQS